MRPKSLAAVAQLAAGGESFDLCLANFPDEFYYAPLPLALSAPPLLLAPILGEPGLLPDAYLAATAEELARAYGFPFPAWASDEARKLHRPWFACSLASVRGVLLLEGPAAFRERNLFVSENALSRV